MNQALRIAQITDTHLFSDDRQAMLGCQTNLSFQAVISYTSQLHPKPDVLLLTGDLSQDESVESYIYLRSQVDSLKIPTYWIPGNHDQELSEMENVLNSTFIHPQKQFQRGGWNFVLLNTMMAGKVQGRLNARELERLERSLDSHDLPAIVVLHHPPMNVGTALMDEIQLENGDELLAILDRFPQVKLVVFGHIHQAFEQQRGTIRFVGTPSTCIQLKPLSQEMSVAALIDDLPPGLRLFDLYPDGQFETEVQRVAAANV
jgi:3',5'-cyclic-AMP phosphodiesterase